MPVIEQEQPPSRSQPPCADLVGEACVAEKARLSICVITYLTSPYQVEFFNEIAKNDGVKLRVVYLRQEKKLYPWKQTAPQHEHLTLEGGLESVRQAFAWCQEADLTVCNYYTHWFALGALHLRHLSGRPWAFWGESPGFLRLGRLGRLGRKMLLWPIAKSEAPIWAVGRVGIAGYLQDWGKIKSYVNLPYFSDLTRFRELPRRARDGECSILYSGVLTYRKGVVELAEAFCAAALQNAKLRLTIMGAGPLEARMRHILEPVKHLVSWTGFRQWHELPDIYSAAHLLCLPTRHDGWAMVIPEALASGLPVLTTREAGAAVELIEDGTNGWLISDTSTQSITTALRHVATLSPDQLHEHSQAARQSVTAHNLQNGSSRFIDAARDALRSFHCQLVRDLRAGAPRLLITGTYAPDGLNSMKRYVNLVQEIAKDYPGETQRVDPPVVLGQITCLPARFRKPLEYVDKYILFAMLLRWHAVRASRSTGCLVHLTDQGLGLVMPWISTFPIIVTCHDLIAIRAALGEIPALRQKRWRGIFQRLNLHALRLPSTMVCVSTKTLADCRRLIGVGHDFHVIHNPLDPEFHQDTTDIEVPGLPPRFLLHVGNSLWYKNRPGVLKIYAALLQRDNGLPPLVLMGDPPNESEEMTALELGIEGHVIWIPRPSGSWIIAAYDRALLLIFPSLEEGFGWPLLEAMSRGCPVVASNRPPLSEIGGAAVEYVDPEDSEAAADVILACMEEGEAWRQRHASSGRARAKDFSMDRFGTEWLHIYQAVTEAWYNVKIRGASATRFQ